MKLFQLSFPLPISLLEYNVGEKFVAYYLENQIIQDSNEENVHYDQALSYPTSSDHATNMLHQLDKFSVPIVKIYQLYSSLPLFAKELFNNRIIKIREEKTQSFPKSSCTYTIENVEGIKISIQTYCIDGLQSIDTPFSTKEPFPEKAREMIDILNLGEDYISQTEVEKIKNHFKIQNEKRWINQRTSGITVYNLINLEVNYAEAREQIEVILKEVIRQFLMFQRKLLLVHYEKWMNYGNQTLERLEKDVKMKSPTKRKSYNIFNETISTYDDLVTKLNLQKAIDVFNTKKVSRESTKNNLFNNSRDSFRVAKKSKNPKKTGYLYKRGDGPINFNWNPRYFILDGATLFYYSDVGDKTPRGMTKLNEATVSPVDKFEDREYVFTIHIPSNSRTFYLSGEAKEDTIDWRDAIAEAVNTKPGLNSPKLRSFTSVDASGEERIKRSPAPPPLQRNSIEMGIESSAFQRRSPSGRYDSPDDNSPQRRTHFGRSSFKAKSRVLNELSVGDVPDAIKELEADINQIRNLNKEKWGIKHFTNGVKVMDMNKQFQTGPKLGLKSWGTYGIVFALALLLSGDFVFKIALLGFAFCLYFINRIQTINKRNRTEVIGRVIVEEDALKIFQKAKKLKVKNRWDLNFRNISKIETREIARDKRNKQYEADLMLPKVNWLYFDGLKALKCKVDKWHFILDEDTFVIVEVAVLNDQLHKTRNHEFKMTEIFVAQKFSKMSGKCIVTLLNKINTNFLSTFQLDKLRSSRIQNLSVIRDFLSEEFFYQQTNVFDTDEEERRSDFADDHYHAEKKTSILIPETPVNNRLRALNFTKEIEIEKEKEVSIMKHLESNSNHKTQRKKKLVTKDGFDWENKKDLREDIDVVQSLIMGTCTKRGRPLEERKPGYKIIKSGGIECCNPDEIKCQEGIVIDLMKTAGKTLMEGTGAVGISLPVRIFEPRSSIERMCDGWAFGPIYLNRAANTHDPIERMKDIISFCISGLHMLCKQMKPFNPIIGETYQGYWPDGTSIHCEHTSHHPPITNFFIEDVNKKYTYSGYYELKGQLKGNAVLAQQFGPNIIKFKDGSQIKFVLPPFRLAGLLFGARTVDFQSNIVFTDEKHDLEAKIAFYENPSLFSKNLHPSDYFEGSITKKSDKNHIYSKITGQWTSYVEFDGQRYWDLKIVDPILHIDTNEPLLSDCRYREDLIYLARKDLVKSQEHKIRLEKIQRAERKLRLDFKEKEKEKNKK